MHPLQVYLSYSGASTFTDVTDQHIFLGYKPLLIGLYVKKDDAVPKQATEQDVISLNFQVKSFTADSGWQRLPASRDSVARLLLKKINHVSLDGGQDLMLYKGEFGEHQLLSSFHQLVGNVRERFVKRKQGNVSLENNLYDQVRIAYSIPRNISLIALSDGHGKMNLFPTDLHGPLGDAFYAGSLRVGGKANEQVEQYRKIVISQVSAAAYREVYGLGKNHMAPLREEGDFDLLDTRSLTFRFPLPASVQRYRELELMKSIDAGIHRIHIYKTVYTSPVAPVSELSHIHMHYAQWRTDKHLHTQMFFR